MIRALGLAGLLALAAGCSKDAASGKDKAALPSEPSAAQSPVSPLSGGNPAGTNAGGGLTGQTSGLAGDRSGLSVRVTESGVVVDLPADALFEYDKADLTPAAETELRKAADLIRRSPEGAIQVIGHTDSNGADAYNMALSEARARTVAAWFGQQVGVRQRTFEVSGKGETAPIAPNETASGADDPQGRAKNRRVEVVLPKA